MSRGQSLQDPYLNVLRKERVPVSIYLVNGIKLQGQIDSFDQFVVLLKNTVSQMVYKHAISTVVPSRPVRLPMMSQGHSSGGHQGGYQGGESRIPAHNNPQQNNFNQGNYGNFDDDGYTDLGS